VACGTCLGAGRPVVERLHAERLFLDARIQGPPLEGRVRLEPAAGRAVA
jgi:hypothetical protein